MALKVFTTFLHEITQCKKIYICERQLLYFVKYFLDILSWCSRPKSSLFHLSFLNLMSLTSDMTSLTSLATDAPADHRNQSINLLNIFSLLAKHTNTTDLNVSNYDYVNAGLPGLCVAFTSERPISSQHGPRRIYLVFVVSHQSNTVIYC